MFRDLPSLFYPGARGTHARWASGERLTWCSPHLSSLWSSDSWPPCALICVDCGQYPRVTLDKRVRGGRWKGRESMLGGLGNENVWSRCGKPVPTEPFEVSSDFIFNWILWRTSRYEVQSNKDWLSRTRLWEGGQHLHFGKKFYPSKFSVIFF